MGSLALKMGFSIWVCFCFLSFNGVYTEATSLSTNGFQSIEGNVVIDGGHAIGITDSDFICATMDWWPPEKCDYGTCAWDHSSMLNLDLNNIIFLNAIKAFSPLKIRLGGSLQDKVIYQTEDNLQPCIPFTRNNSEMFGFTSGCLPLSRWDELNYFFNKSGAQIVFGLNALQGRVIQPDKSATGAWDSKNAESLMRYTVKKGYNIRGWELGNELCGTGVGLHVAADQYAYDTISLRNLVEEIYNGVEFKPKVISPGGFFEAKWFQDFVNKANNSVDAITHHIYNLGPGVDDHLVSKILDPLYLDGEASVFRQLQSIVKSSGSNASAWVGESGGAYNSGRDHVTNAFVFSFWYLDQLGMASSFDTKTYCRQSLIGGNYGLLNTTTFVPNPDYYSALLWHRLMGREVLATTFTGTKRIRAYSHCAKQSKGVTLLLINLDGNTTVEAKVSYNNTWMPSHRHGHHHRHGKTIQMPRESKTGVIYREEYHLTAKDRNLQSRIMMLNGSPLMIDSDGGIPLLSPILVDSVEPISVGPYSIVFIHMSYVHLPACK